MIKIGGIDIAQTALDTEFRVIVLETIIEKILNKIGGSAVLSQQELESIREQAIKTLQKKYPEAGLERKK